MMRWAVLKPRLRNGDVGRSHCLEDCGRAAEDLLADDGFVEAHWDEVYSVELASASCLRMSALDEGDGFDGMDRPARAWAAGGQRGVCEIGAAFNPGGAIGLS